VDSLDRIGQGNKATLSWQRPAYSKSVVWRCLNGLAFACKHRRHTSAADLCCGAHEM